MDALAKALAVLLVSVMVLTPLAVMEDSDADAADGLLLYQVDPYSEGVAVKNYGSTTVNMSDYTITDSTPGMDNEGTLTFSGSITVGPGEVAVFASKTGTDFSGQPNTIIYDKNGSNGVTSTTKFNLNNSGDDVYLYKDGKLVDAVCHGNTVATQGWSGPAVDDRKDHWIQRFWDKDTDTSYEWRAYYEGATYYEFDPDLQYDATVTPFLFPESGGVPIYQALEQAQESIRIEMYQLGNKNVLSLLCQKIEEDHVDVDILLEGNSLDGGSDPIAGASGHLGRLLELGADIRLIGMAEDPNDDRYSFDHAKFALIDGDVTIVTSENWTTDNLNGRIDDNPYDSGTKGNRGWGVVIESAEYNAYMNAVFEIDWDLGNEDVVTITDEYGHLTPGYVYYKAPSDWGSFPSYSAKVTPILSSDNSFDALEYYVSNAKERAYTQQQSLGAEYADLEDGSPIMLFADAADRGVDSRIVFEHGNSDKDKTKIENAVDAMNTKTLVKGAYMDTPYVHNKGVICDDVAWVSSVNWTSTSFHQNRECCVAIQSREVADFFAESFIQDFDRVYSGDGIRASIEMDDSYPSGAEITPTVHVIPETGDYTYVWDLGDGSEPVTSEINRMPLRPADGTHTLTVTVTDAEGNVVKATHEYSVGVQASGDEDGGEGIGALISDNMYILIVIVVLVVFAIIGAARGGSKKKGKKRR